MTGQRLRHGKASCAHSRSRPMNSSVSHGGSARGVRTQHSAATERSTSSALVDQFDTEIRTAARPFHFVPLIQQVPVVLQAFEHSVSMPVLVAIRRMEADEHLVEHYLVEHLDSVGSGQLIGKAASQAQQRSTISAMPLRPSARIAAYTAKPRARRECSGL